MEEAQAEIEEEEDSDPLFERAKALAQEHSRISASMLQRRLRIGYPRAARLMDMLEEEGVIGAAGPGGSREVIGLDGFSVPDEDF
jgi:S-DNA-T family DNA segregation ATPase FtsK/SpoIIIE